MPADDHADENAPKDRSPTPDRIKQYSRNDDRKIIISRDQDLALVFEQVRNVFLKSSIAVVLPGLLVVAVLLGAFTFTALGLALAGAVRAELVLAGSNAVYLAMVALSDLVFDLPDAADAFIVWTPSGALGIVTTALKLRPHGHSFRFDELTTGTHLFVRRADGSLVGAAVPRREGVAIGD